MYARSDALGSALQVQQVENNMYSQPASNPRAEMQMLSGAVDLSAGEPDRQRFGGEDAALKEELAQLRQELHDIQHMLDRVLADYIDTQASLEEKSRLLTEKGQLISRLEAGKGLCENRASEHSANEAHELSLSIQASREQDTILRQLRDDKSRLESALGQYELRLAEEEAGRQAAEQSLATETQRGDSLETKVAALQAKVEANARDGKAATFGAENNLARAAGVGLGGRMGAEAGQEVKVKELQGLVDFFKRNSERSARRVKELTRELEELNSTGHF